MLRNQSAAKEHPHDPSEIQQRGPFGTSTTDRGVAGLMRSNGKDQLRSFISASSGLVWIADPNGKIDFPENIKEAGFQAENNLCVLHENGWLGIIHPKDKLRIAWERERILGGKVSACMEFHACGVSHSTSHVRVQLDPDFNSDGTVREWIGTCLEFALQTQERESSGVSDLQFRTWAQYSPVGIFFTDAAGCITFCNETLLQLTGLSKDECCGTGIQKAIHEMDQDQVLSGMDRYFKYPVGSWKSEFRFLRKDGTVVWVQAQVGPMQNEEGLLGFSGTVEDITERKRSEDALRKSEALYSSIFRASPVAAAISGLRSGQMIEVNEQFCHYSGYSREELIGSTLLELNLWASLQDRSQAMERLLKEGAIHNMETRYRRKSGEMREILLSLDLAQFAEETGPVLIALITDITEKKRAEERLRQNEALLRMATRVGRLGAWAVDLQDHRLIWSEEVRAIHEVPSDYTPGIEEAIRFYAPEYQDVIREAFEKCVRSGIQFDLELQIVTANSRQLWVRVIGEAQRNSNSEISRVQGAFQDISERKEAAEQTRLIADQLATTLESITDAFFMLSHDWRFSYINKEAEKLLKRSRADLLGKVVWTEFKEAVGSTFDREYRRAIAENCSVQFEEYFPPLETWFEVRAFPSAEGLAVYFRDVTEQRKSREVLRASDERFQLLCKATNDLIWDWDSATGEVWRSEAFELLFGFARKELQGSSELWASCIHPDDKDRVCNGFQKAVQSGEEHWSDEYRFRRKDGLYAYVIDRGFIIRNSEGKVVRIVGAMTDITRRQEAEDRLQENEQRLRNAQRIAALGSWDYDLQKRKLYWSDELYRIFGVSSETFTPDYAAWFQYVHPEDRKRVQELVENAIRDQKPVDVEHRIVRPDGQVRHVHQRGEVVFDAKSGMALRRSGTTQDITERKKLETRFLRAQRMESIGTLAGGIAHDINNILAPILMALEILRDKVTDQEGYDLLETLESCAKRGSDLIRQVLSFSRGMEGQHVILNPMHLVKDVQKIVFETFPKNIECRIKSAKDLWSVAGDATQVHQVLMNLCVNARDAMPHGGRLDIALENRVIDETFAAMNPEARPGAYIVLKVGDSGTGIPQEIREKIFEPFFTTKEMGRGTGLGLSTTLAIVRGHGGFIMIESELGRGTSFSVYLPAVTSMEKAEVMGVEHAELNRGHGELILVVDDEKPVRDIARRTLELAGYRVLVAQDGAEAIGLYAQHQEEIALVLTDMSMPVMDGVATITALKKLNPAVKVVANSGFSSGMDDTKALNAGVNHFLSKPYTARTMLKVFAELLHPEGKETLNQA